MHFFSFFLYMSSEELSSMLYIFGLFLGGCMHAESRRDLNGFLRRCARGMHDIRSASCEIKDKYEDPM